jgi:hypothetical protein
MNIRVSQKAQNVLTSWATVGNSRRTGLRWDRRYLVVELEALQVDWVGSSEVRDRTHGRWSTMLCRRMGKWRYTALKRLKSAVERRTGCPQPLLGASSQLATTKQNRHVNCGRMAWRQFNASSRTGVVSHWGREFESRHEICWLPCDKLVPETRLSKAIG